MARVLRLIFWGAVCLCLVIGGLVCVTQVPLPAWAIERITRRVSTPAAIFRVQKATIGLQRGLALGDVQFIMNLGEHDFYVKADALYLSLAVRPGKSLVEWIDSLTLVRARGSFEPARLPSGNGRAFGDLLRHLRISRVGVTLEEPVFAGLEPQIITADLLLRDQNVVIDNCRIEWMNNENEYVAGSIRLAPATRSVEIEAAGYISQQHVRPIIRLVNSAVVLHYCDNVTSTMTPLKASCKIVMSPEREKYQFRIEGRNIAWRGIPVDEVVCGIDAENPVGQEDWRVTISPLAALTPAGKASATLEYKEASGELSVDAESLMVASNLFNVIEVLHTGELDRVQTQGRPSLTLKGVIDADSRRYIPYRLDGTIAVPQVNLYGLPLTNATCDLAIRDQWLVMFDNVNAGFSRGGDLTGRFGMALTNGYHSIPFEMSCAFSNATLHDILLPLNRTNAWEGLVAGEGQLRGNLATNIIASLNGGGRVALSKGVIARVPLFAGFTDYLARNVPGIDMLVSQSDALLVFRIRDGVVLVDDFLVEGSFFSIAGKGTYDIAQDMIEATARVNIFRRGSFAGIISRIITMPFDRLLMEFRVTGPAENPEWNYRGIISRIVEGVSGASSATPAGRDKSGVQEKQAAE